MRIKKVIFKNCYGEEITFTRHFPLYVEKIDTFGYSGRFNSDKLIDSPGQFTSSFDVSGKVMPAEFAFWDRYGDSQTLKKIERVFTPLKTGLLTVFDTDDMIYRIDAYPTAAPAFQRTGRVIRWSVSFAADYPYWEKGYEDITAEVPANVVTAVYNPCMISVPPILILPPYSARTIEKIKPGTWTTVKRFSVNDYTDGKLIINTKNFSVVNENGENKNNVLYTNAELDEMFLEPGVNYLRCLGCGFTVQFKELTAGVI